MHCVYSQVKALSTRPKTCWVSFIWLTVVTATWLYVQIVYLLFALKLLYHCCFLPLLYAAYPAYPTLLLPCFCCTAPFCVPACFLKPAPLFLLPAFQSELRHGPFYYMKQPALTTDPVDVVPQDGRNDFYCWLCHREGQVLCCELCPRVYHAKCLKLPAEPEGDWFCPECEVSHWRLVGVCVGVHK